MSATAPWCLQRGRSTCRCFWDMMAEASCPNSAQEHRRRRAPAHYWLCGRWAQTQACNKEVLFGRFVSTETRHAAVDVVAAMVLHSPAPGLGAARRRRHAAGLYPRHMREHAAGNCSSLRRRRCAPRQTDGALCRCAAGCSRRQVSRRTGGGRLRGLRSAGMPRGRRRGQGLYSHEGVDVHAAMCLALRLGGMLRLVPFVIAQVVFSPGPVPSKLS